MRSTRGKFHTAVHLKEGEEIFCEHYMYEQQYVLDELTIRSHALRRGIRPPGWQRMVGGGDVVVGVGRASSSSAYEYDFMTHDWLLPALADG